MFAYVLPATFVLQALSKQKADLTHKLIELVENNQKQVIKLYTLPLFYTQLTNGLNFSYFSLSRAQELLSQCLNLPVEIHSLQPRDYQKILELAHHQKTSIYDTSYHYLAKILSATLLTCDKKYFRKAQNFGNIELI
jgi:hypothetical protein